MRGRAFTQIEDPSIVPSLPIYAVSAPLSPPRASGKTVEIRRLVSPTRPGGATRQAVVSPSGSMAASAGRTVTSSATPSPKRDAITSPPTATRPPPAPAATRPRTDSEVRKMQRVSQWKEEAARLSMRVKELEKENQSLRRTVTIPPTSLADGELEGLLAALSEAETPSRAQSNGIPKSKSFANGFGQAGLTVAEAAAASHRSRSKRMGKEPLQKYKSGYWNEQNKMKTSFSLNNLAEMEQTALSFEKPRPTFQLQRSNSTTSRSVPKPNLDGAALIRTASRMSDSFNRSSLDQTGEEMAAQHKQQLAIAHSFHGTDVTQASPPMRSYQDTDIDEMSDEEWEVEEEEISVTSPRSYFEASLRGIGGSFRLPDRSKSLAVTKRPSTSDVRIWVGTWNMGAADPFVDRGGIMDEQRSGTMLQNFVPHGYHVYVLGVQEGVSENVYHAVAAYLNRNEGGTRYFRMELKNSDFMVLNKSHPTEATIDAVRGRGDGAFVGTKFTGLAVFYASSVQDKVQLLRAGVHKFNLTSGSKGGVAVALMINQTSMVFVNCHLDARNDGYRREQIRTLNANLGKVMGHQSFDLTEQFHHVVWMGDMNYRIVHLDPDIVLHMLEEGRNAELHDKFDGLLNDRRNGGIFDGFTEPNKFPDFYPTYKKFPKRGNVNHSLPSWTRLVYRVLYKEPFYKGGKVKKRVPGWCDRILIHSLLVSDSKLMPEKVQSPFDESGGWIDNYRSVNDGDGMDVSDHSPVYGTFVLSFPQHSESMSSMSPRLVRRNSRSMSTASVRSTPTPPRSSNVGGSYFDQPHVVRRIAAHVPNRSVSTVLRVFNMQLYWNDKLVVPKRTRVVAPLIGEDLKQCDVIGERCQGLNGLNLSLNAVVQHSRPLEHLHMLVWVKNDSITGHCTLSLKRVARQEEGGEVKFRVPLYNNSMRLYYDGHPLVLVFSVRSKTFAK
ncbi:hypothetical protein Poli38472_003614 [Pythium oligandrum]|uniref:Inositol polyphosphate-related phosphatase domain-containing protein n=1 Tax=Pythium oligandrum TaxID=41045 RepID=A0A8K1FM25_PYTOL|nr:hypothetical protein Poli38472_003614 [Pythium oligandrum]|eukprot:TMW65849.1 hypothetical protein Poli38472_003614 [Pythium oligandrum]